jgi:formamidopyrimidine-DNA glycosylase
LPIVASFWARLYPVPELPDVEHERRFLAAHASGRTIRRVVVPDDADVRNTAAQALGKALAGQRFEEPTRHGKWLIAWTSGPAVHIHIGMTGNLDWSDGPDGRHRHDRVIFEMDEGELRYRNMRRLGGVWLAHDKAEVQEILADLGPDALALGRRELSDLLATRKARIKPALMDQRLVAGLGNLLVDEVLWQARLHPIRRLDDLSREERDRVAAAIEEVVKTSVERFDHVPRMEGWLTYVRGAPGARCPRCRTTLGRSVVGGRTTYSCPSCQPAP